MTGHWPMKRVAMVWRDCRAVRAMSLIVTLTSLGGCRPKPDKNHGRKSIAVPGLLGGSASAASLPTTPPVLANASDLSERPSVQPGLGCDPCARLEDDWGGDRALRFSYHVHRYLPLTDEPVDDTLRNALDELNRRVAAEVAQAQRLQMQSIETAPLSAMEQRCTTSEWRGAWVSIWCERDVQGVLGRTEVSSINGWLTPNGFRSAMIIDVFRSSVIMKQRLDQVGTARLRGSVLRSGKPLTVASTAVPTLAEGFGPFVTEREALILLFGRYRFRLPKAGQDSLGVVRVPIQWHEIDQGLAPLFRSRLNSSVPIP